MLTFENDGLDRAAHLRGDEGALARLMSDPSSRAVVLWHGRPLLEGEQSPTLARLALGHRLLGQAKHDAVFLGLGANGARFAYELSDWPGQGVPNGDAILFDDTRQSHPDLEPDQYFGDLRMLMADLPALDAGLAASAKAILGWHENHEFCAKCGAPTFVSMAGWQRQCPSCEARHFPRTDPVVIMLVTHGDSVLVGRSPGWPEGMMSLLAGFVEPGETLETAVRREVWEETAVRIGAVDYLTSQPWPFPSSLMIGCRAQALSTEITIDPVEIEQALWLRRQELLDIFSGARKDIFPARRGSVAHYLLRNWLAGTTE